MNAQELMDTAKTLVAGDKGLLAVDESNPTCNKRFARLGIPQTEAARRAWRELLVTTPGLGESISGAIPPASSRRCGDGCRSARASGARRVGRSFPPGSWSQATSSACARE